MQYYYESNADIKNYCYAKISNSPFAELHFHQATEMILVKSGKLHATIGDTEYVLLPGQGCFVDRLTLHAYSHSTPDTKAYVLVGDYALWEGALNAVNGKPPVVFNYDDYSIIERTVQLYSNEKARLTSFLGAVYMICSQLAVEGKLADSQEHQHSFDISPVLYYIDENFRSKITLTDLAKRFGYTPQYFSKIFHRYMNVNLTEYVNAKRVSFAHAMLGSNKTVADIAEESGFSSTVSFYRAYKKAFGKLPRD